MSAIFKRLNAIKKEPAVESNAAQAKQVRFAVPAPVEKKRKPSQLAVGDANGYADDVFDTDGAHDDDDDIADEDDNDEQDAQPAPASSAAAAAAAALAKRAKKSNGGMAKRPRDLILDDAAQRSEVLRKSVEPADAVFRPASNGGGGEESESVSARNVFSLDTYPVTQRYFTEAIVRSAEFEQQGSDRDAANVKAAFVHAQQRRQGINAAAYTNYLVRHVGSERARTTNADGVVQLDATPYSDSTVSAFSLNFIAASCECTPDANAHEHMPSDEMRAASQGVPYDYMITFMRTAHPNEYACASRDACVGMQLCDEHGKKLPPSVWKVFWFPDELDAVNEDPAKYADEAKYRCCIGCKIYKANKCLINVASRNNRVLPDVLASDFHVFVDVPGEFPIVATRGRGTDGHYGLVQNIPVFSRIGWQAVPDGQRANCFVYKWDVPTYPIPPTWYTRNTAGAGRGF